MEPHQSPLFLAGRTDKINQLAHISLLDSKDNTAVGVNTAHVLGTQNTTVGAYAGTLDARSRQTVLLGERAGHNARTAIEAVAVGAGSLARAVLARQSVFVGFGTGESARSASLVTSVGHAAGAHLSTAARSTYVGALSGQFSLNSLDDTFVGFSSGKTCRDGSRNACLGAFSGTHLEAGSENVFVGYKTGANVGTAHRCVAIGALALEHAANSSNVIAIGTGAGQFATGARDAVFIGSGGSGDGQSGLDTANSVYIGVNTGFAGSDNVGVGTGALPAVTGRDNVAVGTGAGTGLLGGNSNVLIGSQAGANTLHHVENVCVGVRSGNTGSFNTLVGYATGGAIRGNSNSVLGWGAGNVARGDNNVLLGRGVGATATGSQNVLMGALCVDSVQGNTNVVMGSDVLRTLTGSNNVAVGSQIRVTAPLDNSVILGSEFDQDFDLEAVANSVIIGTGFTLNNRDSDTLILGSRGLGDVIRATKDGVSFGTGIIAEKAQKEPAGPIQLLSERYTRPEFAVASDANFTVRPNFSDVATKFLWYDVLADASPLNSSTSLTSDGFYGPADRSMLQPDGSLDPPIPTVTRIAPPTDGGWATVTIPATRIQGRLYTEAHLHGSGLCCFGNRDAFKSGSSNPSYGVPVGEPTAACLFGPTVAFGPLTNTTMSHVFHFGERELGGDHAATMQDLGAHFKHSVVVLRWEAVRAGTQLLVAEISILYPAPQIRGSVDDVVRLAWSGTWPKGWDGNSIAFTGLDGGVLGHRNTALSPENLIYFVPKTPPPSPRFTAWAGMSPSLIPGLSTKVPLKHPLRLFDRTFDAIYVHRSGYISFGSALAPTTVPTIVPDIPVLVVGSQTHAFEISPHVHFVSQLLDGSQLDGASAAFDASPRASSTETYVRLEAVRNARLYIVELAFSSSDMTILYTDTYRNSEPGVTFALTYENATYPIPHSSKASYKVTTNLPPHVFAGGKVRVDSAGITLTDAVYKGNGAQLTNIDYTQLALPGTYGDGYFAQVGPVSAGAVHAITANAISAARCFSGLLGVFVSNATTLKAGTATLSVLRYADQMDVALVTAHKNPNLAQLDVDTDANNTITVTTDPGCDVTWKFDGACFRSS